MNLLDVADPLNMKSNECFIIKNILKVVHEICWCFVIPNNSLLSVVMVLQAEGLD